MALSSRQRESLRKQQRRKKDASSLLVASVHDAPDSLRATAREYLSWCETRAYTPATVQHRADSLKIFVEWCGHRALSKPSEVTRPILERYQRHLFLYRKVNGKPLGAATQHGRLVALKDYFRFLVKQGHLGANPASELELPRLPRHLPQDVLSPAEVEKVLAVPDISTSEGLRDRAMLEVLYSTGLRRAEVCALSAFSLKADSGVVFVREGKGRRDRVVPIGERALAWVAKYLNESRPRLSFGEDCGVLFLTELGEAFHPNRFTEVARRYVQASGVAKRGACHLFRHAMATHMLEAGADVRFLQAMLGHASLESTQVYTHVSIRQLKEIHAATHPAARLLRSEKKEEAKEAAAETAQAFLVALHAEGEEEISSL